MSGRIQPARIVWGALVVAMVGAAVLIFHLTRGTTLWFDDWNWALYRRGDGVHSLLADYNGHLSLVPVLIYKLLFATEGIGSYTGYRIVVILGHLLVVGLVFVYVRRRLSDYLALLCALLILFLGPAWQDILWPFQIAWLVSIAAGLGALLLLERRDHIGDAAACLLLLISVASSSIGVPILAGALVEVAWSRRRWRDAWIVGVPLILYAVWALAYQHSNLVASDIFQVPRWAASSAAAAVSSLAGLSGQSTSDDAGTVLQFGAPLALAGLLVVVWRTRRGGPWPLRAVTFAVIALVFWILTAVGRAFLGHPYASRYEYVDCVFVLLFAVELAAGSSVRVWLGALLGVVTVAAVLSNIGIMREAGAYLRSQAPIARADLAALDITRGSVPANYVASAFPGYPFLKVPAGGYFATRRSIGSPAYSVAGLATAPPEAQLVADTELTRIHGVALSPGSPTLLAAQPPAVEQAAGGAVSRRGSCAVFTPAPYTPAGTAAQVLIQLPPAGLSLASAGAPVSVAIRRFAPAFQPLGTLAAQAAATLRVAPDAAPQRWRVELSGTGPVTICGLATA